MAGGGMIETGGGARAHLYEHKITGYFIYACIIGSMGGSLFGYDLGVSGKFFFQFLFVLFSSYNVCRCLMMLMFLGKVFWVLCLSVVVLFLRLLEILIGRIFCSIPCNYPCSYHCFVFFSRTVDMEKLYGSSSSVIT